MSSAIEKSFLPYCVRELFNTGMLFSTGSLVPSRGNVFTYIFTYIYIYIILTCCWFNSASRQIDGADRIGVLESGILKIFKLKDP